MESYSRVLGYTIAMIEEKSMKHYVTISPAPRKLHNGLAYGCMSDIQQRNIIMKAINSILMWHNHKQPWIHFEYNKKFQLHVHFSLELPCDNKGLRIIKLFQSGLARVLGARNLSPDISINMCPVELWKPKVNPATEKPYASWEEYCNKENILPPKKVQCTCIECKLQYEARTIRMLETGQITLDNEDFALTFED